jgi:broad specificity phosphatase PhoE
MSTRVWLLRHAESAKPLVFHGAESDVGLSEHGERTASQLAPYLASFRPDVVVSSGMRRALATAVPIAQASDRLPVHIENGLHERRIGILQGQPHTPEHPLWTKTVTQWTSGNTSFTTPGAESLDQMRLRLIPIWQKLTSIFAGKRAIVVAHGMVCKVLLLSLLPDWSVARWRQLGPISNLAISELEWSGTVWHAVTLNRVPAFLNDSPRV